ncbi:hypothetical protein DFH27DRAFT_28952 [Peziza echinospora]|nr:hypothetical protein DFH27DRAFT_28952 [Peziza echinospora]
MLHGWEIWRSSFICYIFGFLFPSSSFGFPITMFHFSTYAFGHRYLPERENETTDIDFELEKVADSRPGGWILAIASSSAHASVPVTTNCNCNITSHHILKFRQRHFHTYYRIRWQRQIKSAITRS